MPETCGSQVYREFIAVDAEYSSAGSDRLSDSDEGWEDKLRRGIQANAVRNIVLLAQKKGQQLAGFEREVAGPAEHAVHGSAERMGRYLNADRKSLEAHDGSPSP